MKYLAITQKTAEWLNNDSKTLGVIESWLSNDFNFNAELNKGVVIIGSLRITSVDNKVLCIWNNDYVIGTGDEKWGFIRLSGELGLLGNKSRLTNTFDDFVFVVMKRLSGLLIDHPARKRQSLEKNIHSISNSFKKDTYNIVFKDLTIEKVDGKTQKSVICTGTAPSVCLNKQISQVNEDETIILELISLANNELVNSRLKPALSLSTLQKYIKNTSLRIGEIMDAPILKDGDVIENKQYDTFNFTYEDWMAPDSPLNDEQRSILNSDSLLRRPLRIIGAAGTGKSLLMQLLALKHLIKAETEGRKLRVFYVCHSTDMASNVISRFETLGGERFYINESDQELVVTTMFQHSFETTNDISQDMILSPDASANKEYQKELIGRFLGETIDEYNSKDLFNSVDFPIMKLVLEANAREVFIEALVNEIGVSIKGRTEDHIEQLYTESENPLSRLHSILEIKERKFVYDVFTKYKNYLFVQEQLLDSDDVAISFLQTKKTPVWNLRRKREGFDFVFVDETQLFNENERQLFSLITKHNDTHVPIALALDEAQDLRGSIHRGF